MDSKIAVKQLQEIEKRIPEKNKELRLAAEWEEDWKILISTLLSARTRDETTIAVCEVLFKEYPSLNELANAKIKDIERIIKKINFYKSKTRKVINCAKYLLENYNGKIPTNVEELTKIPGVGRKTANVFLAEKGYDAIGVDTHVSFISQLIGWTKNQDPLKIEEDLKRLFPKEEWRKINYILVRFGRSYSRSKQIEIIGNIKKEIK
ncbi:MAG: endonuclease III [Candidatus Pacearchaeota archaeon]